mgnify:CR=1 FL=1|tara:strand:- start:183 stop:1655 length:1473 start_codon:yes stop_codon:yes gene_type:complete
MSIFNNNLLAGAASQSTTTPVYKVNQSIRFDSTSDALMYSPTPSSSKSFTTTATISMWVKLGKIDGTHYLAGGYYGTGGRYELLMLDSSNRLRADGRSGGASASTGTGVTKWTTTQVFRDPSAWYHLVFVYDTTNSVESERFRLYVNGARVTDFATAPSYGASELVYWFGKSSYTVLGSFWNQTGYADSFYWDGYIAEAHGIDGTALNADSFGEYNSSGIWVPKEYTGSHGTDGFYIKGADANALGTNSADNGNNFTVTNLAAHDQVADSPTNNFPTLNPLNKYGSNVTTSDGNLTSTASSSSNDRGVKATQGITTGKWYFEVYFSTSNADNNGGVAVSDSSDYNAVPGETSDPKGIRYMSAGYFRQNGSSTGITTTITAKDVVMVAIDMDNDKAWFGINGTFISSGDPASGSNPTATTTPDLGLPASYHYNSTATEIFNFGQDSTFSGQNVNANDYGNYVGASDGNGVGSFFYTPPTGYLAICTKNLGS